MTLETMSRAELEQALAEARAATAACLAFMRTEMCWEEFRAEMLYFDDEVKRNASEENARKLRNFLVANGAAFLS